MRLSRKYGACGTFDPADYRKCECNRMIENANAGKKGGNIAKKARLELESKTGKSVITSENDLLPAKKQRVSA